MAYFEKIMQKIGISMASLKGFGITDIIDIAITAYVVFIIMRWIRETRAWSLFKGLIVLSIMKVSFSLFGLYTMNWIIDEIYKVGLIASIVLFQPELRKVLEELGKGKFVFSEHNLLNDTNKEILKAITTLSKVKTGALICIEQEIALGDFEKTGIPIDGVVSSQLLMNIFEDKTPLHDGAVMIRNNRISAAGCIIPVTAQEIGKELGTRHRAAVGLSEISDAIIIVVSEETGGISIARNGKLLRKVSPDTVFDILQRSKDDKKSGKKVRRRKKK